MMNMNMNIGRQVLGRGGGMKGFTLGRGGGIKGFTKSIPPNVINMVMAQKTLSSSFDKKKKIMELDINFGDIIEVVSSDHILETNGENIYTIKKLGKKNWRNLL